jgi:hypothetical protein
MRAASTQETWRTDDGAEETLIDWTPEESQSAQPSRVAATAQAFMALSTDERDEVVTELGSRASDFPSA